MRLKLFMRPHEIRRRECTRSVTDLGDEQAARGGAAYSALIYPPLDGSRGGRGCEGDARAAVRSANENPAVGRW